MTTTWSRYKGFDILSRPYQLHDSTRWTVDFEIRCNGRRQPFSGNEHYRTRQEADARCSGLSRRIIDGKIPGWSVAHLRQTWSESVSIQYFTKAFMRAYIIAGIVLVGLGAFVLIRGGSFTSRRDVLKVGDVKVTADEQQTIPPWAGGLAILAGAGLIIAGARQKG
ncbi:MAG: hypothetical protein ABJD11_00835 [Gemmatimonadota bacterium]